MIKIEIFPKGGHHADLFRIRDILFERGYEATLEDCKTLWERYSDSQSTVWADLPDIAEDVFDCLSLYIAN